MYLAKTDQIQTLPSFIIFVPVCKTLDPTMKHYVYRPEILSCSSKNMSKNTSLFLLNM